MCCGATSDGLTCVLFPLPLPFGLPRPRLAGTSTTLGDLRFTAVAEGRGFGKVNEGRDSSSLEYWRAGEENGYWY